MNAIEVKNLSKRYSYYRKEPGLKGTLKAFIKREMLFHDAVRDISLSIKRGELVGFLGPNGAGKTTTLKMLSGIVEPTSGSARVLGFDPSRRQNEYKKRFGIVMGQKDQLMSQLPAQESFRLIQALYDIPEKTYEQNMNELVDLLKVRDLLDIQVRKLSLGQRMKCELIAALLHKPEVLFLDEPTIGLDVVAQKNIREFILDYNKRYETTIMLTSHYMDDIEALCKRVVIIDHGIIMYDGDLSDLIKKYAPYKLLNISFLKPVTEDQLKEYGEIESIDPYSVTLRVTREESLKAAARLLDANLPVDDILIDEVEVDEIIRRVFEKK